MDSIKMVSSIDKAKIKNMTDQELKIKLGLIPYWMAIANKIKDPKAREKYIERMELDERRNNSMRTLPT